MVSQGRSLGLVAASAIALLNEQLCLDQPLYNDGALDKDTEAVKTNDTVIIDAIIDIPFN